MSQIDHPASDTIDTRPDNHGATESVEIDPRVLFAAERTLLAWIRTGLALMGLGFVVARFGLFLRQIAAAAAAAGERAISRRAIPGSTAPGLSLWLGVTLVALGIFVNLIAIRQHVRMIQRLNRGESLFPATPSSGIYVAGLLALLGIVIAT